MLRSALKRMGFPNPWRRRRAVGVEPAMARIDFPGFFLTIDPDDYGGRMYGDRAAFEEVVSGLYPAIERTIAPSLVIDVGANYGLTALVFAGCFPRARVVAVEASPRLRPYLRENLEQVHADRLDVIHAVCGADTREAVPFGINPHSSQDNRVCALDGWSSVAVPQVSIDGIIRSLSSPPSAIFLKIDTQGYEFEVLRGAEATLASHPTWLVKAEFAPFCLESQGADPCAFLDYLLERYNVFECPARVPFAAALLSDFLPEPLKPGCSEVFVRHVEGLNRGATGWIDLILRPKALRASL